MLLTTAEHNATRSAFARWRYALTGSVTGAIDWTTISRTQVQDLAELMFDAAGLGRHARRAYYEAFERFLKSGTF